MAKNRQIAIGRSRVNSTPMTIGELTQWYDEIILRLYALRRVQNSTNEFRNALLETLKRYGYTWDHAVLAERWLTLGKWHEYRRGGELMITDFMPGTQELESIGELDEQINHAAMRLASAIARTNYIHKTRVDEMLSEVRIATRRQTLQECKSNIEKMWIIYREQNEEIEMLKTRQKEGFSWRFHPKFNSKLLPNCRKV